MEASDNRPVILKGITIPLAIQEWSSEQEILAHFRDDGRPMVKLTDDDYCEKYTARYVTVETPHSVLAIYAQIDAKTAEILQVSTLGLWLVGLDTWVFCVDWRSGLITRAIDLWLPFWMFHALPDGRTLIRYEFGVIMVDATGRRLWEYDGPDILSDWTIGSDVLHLEFRIGFDFEIDLDLDTGAPVSRSETGNR